MANYQNHLIDPTWFEEAVEEFAFDYDWFVCVDNFHLDDLGRRMYSYDKRLIRGSLQSQGTSLNLKESGNTESMKYEFYCMSKYRIKIGDFILYKDRYLHVDLVRDYDEHGVRRVDLTMVNLNNYTDLQDYIRYLEGEKIV